MNIKTEQNCNLLYIYMDVHHGHFRSHADSKGHRMPFSEGARAICHLCPEGADHEGTLCSLLLSCQKVFEACAPMTFRVTYHTTGLRSYSDREDVGIDALAVRRWRKAFQPRSHDLRAIWLVGV